MAKEVYFISPSRLIMNKEVLIYDDDPEILFVSRKILEKQNYKVQTRLRCDNIIKDIAAIKPDIVLMDLWIPDIGGENAIILMKKDNFCKNIPVVVFSANSNIEQISRNIHATDFIKKPFEIEDFVKIVAKNIATN